MFTPPPSPAPFRLKLDISPPLQGSNEQDDSVLAQPDPVQSAAPCADNWQLSKYRTTRRIRWTILLVPIVLVIITLSTRYLTRPVFLEVSSTIGQDTNFHWQKLAERPLHKRHPSPASNSQEPLTTSVSSTPAQTSSSSMFTPAASTSSSGSQSGGTQTVPPIPSTAPVLPTPFPQPLDASLSSNFTTQGCQDFFTNMTASAPFRSCRPFSLLLQTSTSFINAQSNITALSNIIWGTCNTSLGQDQCIANMAWFTESLKAQCAFDMQANNAIVSQTLKGLEAYALMRNTACLADQSTGAYCYVEAVNNESPADLYFYALPLGDQLPPKISPSCSACTKSVMALYAQQGSNLTALSEVYDDAAAAANKACGPGYVATTSPNGGARSLPTWSERQTGLVVLWVIGVATALVAW